jgi:hypothetical protein
MNRCECKSGFFALRACEWNAITQCAECRRMICAPHTAKDSQPAHCLDCWGRRAQNPDTTTRDRTDNYDDDWAYGYRHHYYSTGYAPLSHARQRYDADDARSFTADERELKDDDDPQAGFGDS